MSSSNTSTATASNETPNVLAVQNFLKAQYEGDFDLAFGSYANADKFTWVVGTANNEELREMIPWAGYMHRGKQGYIDLVTQLFGEFESLEFTPSSFVDTGSAVYVEGRFVFKHKVTQKHAVSDFLSKFNMEDNRIIGGQFYENTAAVAEARR